MVLIFSDWSNYVDETGSPRTIDWDNLAGTPRAAAAEAIRQAIVERFEAISTDVEAELAFVFGSYPYGASLIPLVLHPIAEGVDLDAAFRFRACNECIRKLLQTYAVHEPTVASMSGAHQYAYTTDYPELYNKTSGAFTATDPFSAMWARQAKDALDQCHAILAQPVTSTGTPTVSYRPSLVWHPRTIAIRDIWHVEATESATYPTPADLAAALAAQDWAQTPGGYTYGSLLLRYAATWASPTSAYAYRQRSTWMFPAMPTARRADYLRVQRGTLPEAAHAVQEAVLVGPDAGALTYAEGDSKTLANPPSTSYPSAQQGHAWGTGGYGVFLDFAVPGGFTFQS